MAARAARSVGFGRKRATEFPAFVKHGEQPEDDLEKLEDDMATVIQRAMRRKTTANLSRSKAPAASYKVDDDAQDDGWAGG